MKRMQHGGYRFFLAQHRRLLLFLTLLLAGTVGGVLTCCLSGQAAVQIPAVSAQSMLADWLQSCGALWMLLGLLFLAGLAVWGFPVSLAVPVFFGLGVGLAQASCVMRGSGGLAYAALAVQCHDL